MKNTETIKIAVCQKCKKSYHGIPVLSNDNKTLICPDCKIEEALDVLGVNADEKSQLKNIIYKHTNNEY